MKHIIILIILPTLLGALSSCTAFSPQRTTIVQPDGSTVITEPTLSPEDAAFERRCEHTLNTIL